MDGVQENERDSFAGEEREKATVNNRNEISAMMAARYYLMHGDALSQLRSIPDNAVQCVVTSPPYWGLRKYAGEQAQVWGGDPEHDHLWGEVLPDKHPGQVEQTKWKNADGAGGGQTSGSGRLCECGAWLGDLGQEPTPDLYVQHLVEIFREVRRVLRSDGTLWLNIGDTYAGYWGDKTAKKEGRASSADTNGFSMNERPSFTMLFDELGIKPKDLVGIPWMVAFALRADGWYLRQDVIWAKPNPMPESVKDRSTRSHEHVFLLTKSGKYFYDHIAVMEDAVGATDGSSKKHIDKGRKDLGGGDNGLKGGWTGSAKRNRRDVWNIATKPYKGAHFAVFPESLVEPCILAGTSEGGACAECGTPLARDVRRSHELHSDRPQAIRAMELAKKHGLTNAHIDAIRAVGAVDAGKAQKTQSGFGRNTPETQALADEAKLYLGGYYREFLTISATTVGWKTTCKCESALETKPCIVLDPFSGSGTTGVVALRHGRKYLGIEISSEYLELSRKRIEESFDRD